MLQYNITPPDGEKFLSIDLDMMRNRAPSTRLTAKFSDGTINIEVGEEESDALTDHFDQVGIVYKML